ncbi:uncharacterized protein LOC130793593 isoform X2 [Actinidia eriantha]|uniref:uncharacterized protein LOC130793593 isoform X2 n=1 Tax=Actinidia eriantha TaxID=165200 RepID=UPI0025830D3F|nr:uncharacterized protein LOC130793593 isoform X2 [Actinidia eriantha]XP_057511384.1 uncharacterized protein LOC130793593 isoform X2 [Actinidia eriantha]
MSTSFSPSRSPASARLQLGGASRLRSSSLKKPPEPLHRAVADCLSSSAPSHHGSPSAVAYEPSRTLRDYLASHVTTDLAYSVILEHTLAEKERSPAVVGRCVALLKRHLLRYKPSEETLQQIDRFCVSIISECSVNPSRRSSSWSQPSSQQSGASTTTTNISPLPVSSFASLVALVKSLDYVRSLVAQHMPKRSFQAAAFSGAPSASRQALPTLSSLLSKSFNSQLSPANNKDSLENKEASALSVSNSPIVEEVDGIDDLEFIALDVLKWRWCGDKQLSLLSTESDHVPSPQDASTHSFLELGAAALLVGDMEAKMKGQPWRIFGTTDMPYLDQLLQPSLLTTVTSSASARAHLTAITASKRTKSGPHQIWEDSPLSTFRPRARPLFQYRYYSEQQPLRLNPAEVCEVIAAVCSETPSSNANIMTISSKLSNNSGKPSMDVAVSVLIKLVIDMYVLDSGSAAPLTLSMLEEMLNSPRLASRSRAFDLILNLGVHGHLLEPMIHDDISSIEEETYFDNEALFATQSKRKPDYSKQMDNSSATNNFETWILGILYEILLHLVHIQEKDESVWASALSCLLYFVCDRGKIRRNRLEGLDIRVVKVLIEISRRNSWAEIVLSKLICMLTNMFYQASDTTVLSTSKFLAEQVDLIGGIEFIFLELVLSNSREERRNLYLVLFDYVLHLINETCIAAGVSEYSDDEIQPIATLLMLADAPEAFYISVKLGVEGIGELLRRSISAALSSYPNSDRLNTPVRTFWYLKFIIFLQLLEKITEKLDTFTSSFSHLDKEFGQIVQITKSYKSMENIKDGILGHTVGMKVKLSWSTLHSLIHSERLVCRQNGYAWLGDLLMEEISGQRDASIWSNIRNLRQKITLAGVNDYLVDSDIPLPIWLMCGLLKSKNTIIRWGFLFLLERLLMRCKFLLDENELQNSGSIEAVGQVQDNSRLEKANAVIDIMSSALSLVAQINETDRINILKMCDILFSQLCLKVLPSTAMPFRDTMNDGKVFRSTDRNKKADAGEHFPREENVWLESMEDMKSRFGHHNDTPFCETASMAALLLRGQAIVPMQLVARVPAALFYWPLIQLAGAATDNIALGVSVGSKGRGNLPGATSDIRATLLLLLIGKCTADPAAFQEVGGEEFFRELLDDTDSRVAYYSSTFLLKRMMTDEPEKYQRMLQNLVFRAQQILVSRLKTRLVPEN